MKKKTDTTDIVGKVTELRAQLSKIRFAGNGARSKNVREQRTIRKEIARLLTAAATTK